MNYEMSETIIDPAGKYRIRVIIDENASQFFKFDHAPSQEEINSVVENYLQNINKDPLV
jgi:hypothetical protein